MMIQKPFKLHMNITMNKDCYSGGKASSPTAIENAINRLRVEQKMRVLWPDYEVHDLLQAGVSAQELARFTSSPLSILKIAKAEDLFVDPSAHRHCTHMAVLKTPELDDELRKVERFFVVLSKRGLAVDQLNSKFVRGRYIISAQVAQIERQTCLWGVESVSEGVQIISPKYISKSNGMWRVEFQSEKSVRSIIFYSTKREPRYGKGSTYGNQLPKDAKLEFCMKFKNFQSFMDALMNKEEEKIFENVQPFISPRKSPVIFFNSQKGKQLKKESQLKVKNQQSLINHFRNIESSSKKKEIIVKKLQNSSILEINKTEDQNLMVIDLKQVRQLIEEKQKIVHQSTQNNQAIDQSLKVTILSLNFSEIRNFNEKQIENLLKAAQQLKQNDLLEYLLGILVHSFSESHQKTLQNWVSLNDFVSLLREGQTKTSIKRWIQSFMILHCHELLKDCDEDQFESLVAHKALILKGVKWSLQNNSHQNSKISDLLYILMKVQKKKDIFDLYHSLELTDCSVIITPSLKRWQQKQNLYAMDHADIIYQTEAVIQLIEYKPPRKPQQIIEDRIYDFSLTFSHDFLSNNVFLSGKQFEVDNQRFKYFIFRNQSNVYCFIEKIEPLYPSTSEQFFSSFDILIQISINSQKKMHAFQWSFISPSHSIGQKFCFPELCGKNNIQCKISFKRAVIHQSILNYLRVRYEQFLKMQNKCSDKIEIQNKKLLKRRSSLFLEKNLTDDVNFCDIVEQECFLHHACSACEVLTKQTSIYRLSPLDLYQLMLSASFKEELSAFLTTIKYLIITPTEIINKQFWLSQIRIKHLNLHSLLRLVNKRRLDRDLLQIISSLIQQKLRGNMPKQEKTKNKANFIRRNESRVGKNMWDADEADYSAEYLQFLNNAYASR